MYHVNEIFISIQGEGQLTGTPAIFVRFYECNLQCEFCDTARDGWEPKTVAQIVNAIKVLGIKYVVLTGGEPLLANLRPLLDELIQDKDILIGVETNGTCSIDQLIPYASRISLSISPKVDRCRCKIDETALLKAGFHSVSLKILFPYLDDPDMDVVSAINFDTYPCSWKAIVPIAIPGQRTSVPAGEVLGLPAGWRLGVQLHKLLNIA